MTVGRGPRRDLRYPRRAHQEGQFPILLRAADHASLQRVGLPVRVDGRRPRITTMFGASHVEGGWSNHTALGTSWSTAFDVGHAGVEDLVHTYAEGAPALDGPWHVLSVNARSGTVSLPVPELDGRVPLHDLRAGHGRQPVADADARTVLRRPRRSGDRYAADRRWRAIDEQDPRHRAVLGDRHAERCRLPAVLVERGDWWVWTPYTTAPMPYDLSSNGGNTVPAWKPVWIRHVDHAGSESVAGLVGISCQP